MTGFGGARSDSERLTVIAEVRTVNNRFLKVTVRCPDFYAPLESRIEKVIRDSVSRGTVTATIQATHPRGLQPYILDTQILESYWQQLCEVADRLQIPSPQDLGSLLSLPGTVGEESSENVDSGADWPVIQDALQRALEKLLTFRVEEGRTAQTDLKQNCQIIADQLESVTKLAPQVVVEFREKIRERVREMLQDHDATVDDSDLIREVSIFAEKCDINEEITRLRCHLEQFDVFLNEESSQGRKLEFLSQEIFREVNTIGSKANNVEIAHCVVEMKGAVEKIRENLQNIE